MVGGLVDEVRARQQFDPRWARLIREKAEASQQRIADEVGVDRVTVARWEAGVRRPSGQNLVRYMHLLDQLRREVGL